MPARLLLSLAALTLLLPLFFIDLGPWRRLFVPELHILGHIVFFALAGTVLAQTPGIREQAFPRKALVVSVICLAAGGVIELLQPLFNRGGGWSDVTHNALGVATAVCRIAPRGRLRRILTLALVGTLAITLQRPTLSLADRAIALWQFPTLSDFSTILEHHRWSQGRLDDTHARIGERALRVDLKPARFAGTVMRRSLGDWSGHEALQLSVFNAGDSPLTVTISVRDHGDPARTGGYADRFNRRYRLPPGWRDIHIRLDAIREAPVDRSLDLSQISELAVFTTNLESPRTIYVDAVRLTPK